MAAATFLETGGRTEGAGVGRDRAPGRPAVELTLEEELGGDGGQAAPRCERV